MSVHFKKPVDAVALCIPTYYHTVRHPMDYSTIQKKLESKFYTESSQVYSDMNLVLENCFLFNHHSTQFTF